MSDHQPNHRLAEMMKLASFSNGGLAKRVVDLAAEHGAEVRYTHTNVKRWLDGAEPRGLVPDFVAEVFSRRLGRTVTPADIGMESCDSAPLLDAVRYPERLADSVASVMALVRADVDGSRFEGADVIDPGPWADLMVRWLVAPDSAGRPAELPPDARTVAISRATDLFSELDYQFGGGFARSALVEFVRAEVSPLIAQPRGKTRDLLLSAASLLRLTGWTAYDAGRHGVAERYFVQALRLAQAAGDRALGGRILACMSHQANFLGLHDHAANLARAAQRGARSHATPTAMALFHAMEARALAGRGDRRGCEAALVEADRWFEQRSPENDPSWMRYFDAAELAAEFSHSYRDLGMWDRAVEHGLVAAYDADPLYARSISFCRMVLVAGHVGGGEVEQGVTLALAAVQGVTGLRSARVREYLRELSARLDPYRRHQLVAEFHAQVDRLLRTGNGPC